MARPDRYISRSDLGWGPTGAAPAAPRSGLVVHYDSTNLNLASKDHSACLAYWHNTRAFHMGPARGWADVGYSFMGCPHDYILEGRGLDREQAAQPGGNRSHYSVTLATGPSEDITPGHINAVRRLRQWLIGEQHIAATVLGHRDFTATSCPGDRAYALVRNGTFTQPPGATTSAEVSDMLGLAKGDSGERVKLLQLKIRRAGFGGALLYPGGPDDGVDEDYGDATAEGVRLCRAYVGSEAKAGYGDRMTAHAVDQVEAAVVKRMLSKVSGGGSAELPDSESVTITGTLKRS